MTINKIEISQKPFGKLTATEAEVELPWRSAFHDPELGKLDLVVHRPDQKQTDEVIEVKTGPYREFVDYNTGEVGEGGEKGHTTVYRNEQINKLPPLVTGFITETVVSFRWSPSQKDRAHIKE